MALIVNNLPKKDIYIVNLDKEKETETDNIPEGYFNNLLDCSRDFINKACDGIFLNYTSKNKVDLIFCELKSSKPKAKHETQLVNSKLFIDYLISMFNTYYQPKNKLQIDNCKFILFYLDKKRPLKMDKDLRSKVEIIEFPNTEEITMTKYSQYKVIKYPCKKYMYNDIDWTKII